MLGNPQKYVGDIITVMSSVNSYMLRCMQSVTETSFCPSASEMRFATYLQFPVAEKNIIIISPVIANYFNV